MKIRTFRIAAMMLLLVTLLLSLTGCSGKEFEVETKLKKDKIVLEFDNETGNDMAIGWVGGEIKITTSKQIYKETYHMHYNIPEGESEIEIDTSEYKGDIEKIEIREISCLSSRGLPQERISNLVVYDADRGIDGYDDGFSIFASDLAKGILAFGCLLFAMVVIGLVTVICINKKQKKAMAQFAPFAASPTYGAGEDKVADDGFSPPPAG